MTKIHLFADANNVDPDEFPFDMDYVREVLGTDLDIRQVRVRSQSFNQVETWYMLNLHNPLSGNRINTLRQHNISRSGGTRNSLHTQLGDVFFSETDEGWFLFVDAGPGSGRNDVRSYRRISLD